jgi:hypothetical protein
MKTIIYPSLLFIGICLSSLFGCKKENSVSPKFDDYFILEHYTGTRDTFRYEAPYSKALGFNSYKSSVGNYYSGRYVKVFSLFKGVLSDNYELVLAKPDDAITIGQVYRENTPNQIITSFTRVTSPNLISTTASITDIKFSEYKATERISGSFIAYYNGALWFKGEFSFKPTN